MLFVCRGLRPGACVQHGVHCGLDQRGRGAGVSVHWWCVHGWCSYSELDRLLCLGSAPACGGMGGLSLFRTKSCTGRFVVLPAYWALSLQRKRWRGQIWQSARVLSGALISCGPVHSELYNVFLRVCLGIPRFSFLLDSTFMDILARGDSGVILTCNQQRLCNSARVSMLASGHRVCL